MSAPMNTSLITWDIETLAKLAHGQVHGGNAVFSSISTDTRTIQPGALFVALTGPNFDGHAFVAAAAERGATAAIVSKPVPIASPQVVVPDALAGLSTFARH